MKSAAKTFFILSITAIALGLFASTAAAGPEGTKKSTPKPEVKLPEFKGSDIQFTEDEQKFFVYLNKYFPEEASGLEPFESNPKTYQKRFREKKSQFRRLWKGYKHNHKYGELLVQEVKLRRKRMAKLNELKAAEKKAVKQKLRAELKDIVSKEFDIAVKIKEIKYNWLRLRIKRLEKELDRRQEEVKKLLNQKDSEVKKRVEELVNGEEKINWK